MSARAEQLKANLIEKSVERVRERLEPKRAQVVERFLRQFYANVPPDDIIDEAPDNLYGAALALFGFARHRPAGVAKVRVYNPRLEEHGWKSSHTIVEVVNDDMPFLVDSVTADLNGADAEVHLVIHPIVQMVRDDQGKLTKVLDEADEAEGARKESFMHVKISEQPSERLEDIRLGLERVLKDVRAAVEDWRPMTGRCLEIVAELEKGPPPLPAEEVAEGIDFLKWLADDNFTLLGYREIEITGEGEKALTRIVPGSGLGVLRDDEAMVFDGLRSKGVLPPNVRLFLMQPELLHITKANKRGTVHRRVHMDTIIVRTFDTAGKVTGERLFVGLFTSGTYSRSPRDIPVLRRKVLDTVERSGFESNSHDGKALLHILETFPRAELFQISQDDLFNTAMGVLHLQERQRVALFVRQDPFERFISCLVYVPRDRYDTDLRLRYQKILSQAYGGEVVAFATQLTEAVLARLHVIIGTKPGAIPDVDFSVLEDRLVEAARSWIDRIETALIEDRGEEQGIRSLRNFAKAFPASYQEHFNEHTAVFDIARIEETLTTGELTMNLYRPIEAAAHEVHFKIFVAGDPVPLSDVLPMLENMGFRVIGEVPYDVMPAGRDKPVWIHDFEMEAEDGLEIDLGRVKDAFQDTFARVWREEMENDGFNKLVVRAELTAREVTVLRGYCKYLRQADNTFDQTDMEETLKGNPEITRRLSALFQVRFDPEHGDGKDEAGRGAATQAIVGEIEERLEQVSNLDEDRTTRQLIAIRDRA